MAGFTDRDVPDQSGRCFIVTGANTGIGFEAANALAGKGARVLLACRDRNRGEEAVRRIGQLRPGADLRYLPLDLADLDSVRSAAGIASGEGRIDALIANAGVMYPPLTRTAQGFELQWGVNHLGHFALSALLLPKLAETPGSRVVITSSIAHKPGRIDFANLDASQGYRPAKFYSQSKLANMLHFFELDRRLRLAGSSVSALGCHPGTADTELTRHLPPFIRIMAPLGKLFLGTAATGAWPALQAATDPSARGGDYFGPQGFGELRGVSGPARRSPAATDPALARRLWDVSVEMTGIDPGLPPD